MNNFLKKLFNQSPFVPPELVLHQLSEKFPGVINVEWNKSGNQFEAIFYKDQLEYIALFSKDGELTEYKMSLSEELLPAQIKQNLISKGEIMNAVLTNKGNAITYEVIIRDNKLIRYVLLLNETGNILQEKKL
ncbi:MAG: hypothetical protein JXR22_00365 [Prolixibacteraceae bacterium]|nr:hypothetical protein [Prolixibacteraceae bacterium]